MLNRFALLLLAAAAASACATTQAKAPVERPTLEVPAVPARVVEPAPLPQPPPPEPVGDLPPVSPSKAKAQQQRDTKPDPKVEAPPAEPATPPAQPPVQPVVPPLRTANTPPTSEATRQINEINARAMTMLNTLDYGNLSNERKAQWQNAKLLISQSEDALRASNYEFARNLAEKAERLAKELQGR